MGQVLTVGGQPVKGARVELWQANTHGRYTHPSDTNPAPLDPNFEGSLASALGGQRPRLAAYVAGTGPGGAADAAGEC